MHSLSIAIITFDEEKNIRACLKSVSWADEIIIVDGESKDRTIEICREFTDRIFVRKWPGFAAQKQFALEQCTHNWVLSLDADERIRPELAREIQDVLNNDTKKAGYLIARRSYFLGQWIRHCGWYPGYQVRLFRKSLTCVSNSRVHEGFVVTGEIGRLAHDIDHFSHPSLHSSLEKLNRYSTLEAIDRLERKKVHWYDFVLHTFSAFLVKYIGQKGFLDGMHGFLLSWISAFLKMVLYMKIWLLQRSNSADVDKIKEEVL